MPAIAVLYVSLWSVFFIRMIVAYAYAKWFGLEVLCVGLAGPGPEALFKRFQYKGHNLIFGGLFVPYIELEHMSPSWSAKKMLKLSFLPVAMTLVLLFLVANFVQVPDEVFVAFGIPLEGQLAFGEIVVGLDAGTSFQEIINKFVIERGAIRGVSAVVTFLFLLHVIACIADDGFSTLFMLIAAVQMSGAHKQHDGSDEYTKDRMSFARSYVQNVVAVAIAIMSITSG